MTHRPRTGLSLATVLAVLVALAVGAAGGYLFPKADPNDRAAKKQQEEGKRPERITALGRLQPAGGVIPVYGPPGDQILKLGPKIAIGAKLDKDDIVAVLKSSELREQEVSVAKKQLDEGTTAKEKAKEAGLKKIQAAEADLKLVEETRDADLKALRIKMDFTAKAVTFATTQVSRVKNLQATVRVAEEEVDKAELQLEQAKAEAAGAVALHDKASVAYTQQLVAGRAKVKAAEAELEAELAKAGIASGGERVKLAEKVFHLTTLRVPSAGTVLKVTGRDGQPTGIEPIIQFADLSSMTAVAEVYESDVRHLKDWLAGGRAVKAVVRSPALGKPDDKTAELTGEVTAADITGMIARNTVFAMGPREDADRRVVDVVVRLRAEDAPRAAGLVGLQVTVELTK